MMAITDYLQEVKFMAEYGGENKKAVITGLGFLTPIGTDSQTLWDHLNLSVDGLPNNNGSLSPSPKTSVIGEDQLNLKEISLDKKLKRFLNRSTALSLKSIDGALKDSGVNLEQNDRTRMGLFLGKKEDRFHDYSKYMDLVASLREFPTQAELYGEIVSVWPKVMSAIDLLKAIPNLDSFLIGGFLKMNGPSLTILSPEISGLQAVEHASSCIKQGNIDIAIVAGVNHNFSELELLRHEEDLGDERIIECSAALVLESMEHAVSRNAKIYAEIGAARSYTFPEPGNETESLRVFLSNIEAILIECDMDRDINGLVNQGAFYSKRYASFESELLENLWKKNHAIRFQSMKPLEGYLGAASGLLQMITFLIQLTQKKLIGNITTENPPSAKQKNGAGTFDFDTCYALVNSFGRDGFSSSVALKSL